MAPLNVSEVENTVLGTIIRLIHLRSTVELITDIEPLLISVIAHFKQRPGFVFGRWILKINYKNGRTQELATFGRHDSKTFVSDIVRLFARLERASADGGFSADDIVESGSDIDPSLFDIVGGEPFAVIHVLGIYQP